MKTRTMMVMILVFCVVVVAAIQSVCQKKERELVRGVPIVTVNETVMVTNSPTN